MKFIPILFSTPMVQAIDTDRKNQTRRTKGLEKVNENPDEWLYDGFEMNLDYKGPMYQAIIEWFVIFKNTITEEKINVKCPYSEDSDVLWVRESFNYIHDAETDKFIRYGYKANWVEGITSHPKNKGIWKPSIHMPKKACRLFLRIKDIRVERLKDISEIDAIAEGIHAVDKKGGFILYENYRKNYRPSILRDPNKSFFSLWESINGKESLELNPWVWVIEFEKIEKPENFL